MNEVLPLVSVGIPTYNRPEGLDRTLQYLQQQSYQHLDIIVSDNCSTDARVKEVIERNAKVDGRIRSYVQSTNIEIEPNFNFVYHQSKGKYFMWLADDDQFDLDYILKCVEFLEKHSDYVLCSGISIYYRDDQFLFKEKAFNLINNNPVMRMIGYFYNVYKNGIFYGVYRNNINFENPIQKHIGGDWNHIARTSLYGKINILEDVTVIRSDDGGSSSRAKIVSRWKAKGLKNIFMETFTAYQVSKYLFNERDLQKKYSFISRFCLQAFVFILLNFKFFFHAINKRLKRN